ncbi:septation protein SepH [Alloscardovia criceti]|uniref:septation protein SepH n=1 Tax=Alloscardovia criceti TaxID=356828 RepID=UPI00037C7BF8|nr:septation protein SepH [Alloscardovia criceti]
MAENSGVFVAFDHVDVDGFLVIRNPQTREIMRLDVTDELEQGILAAKQIKRDTQGAPQPHEEKALPLSAIQSLIRAGNTPEEISAQNGISAALVRRFASPVEKEKKFMVSQFLDTVLTSQDSSATVHEIIIASMASLAADYASLEWKATRQGHNPWRIQSTYHTAHGVETAEWMFNPRDKSIVSVNTPAKRLLGEISNITSPVDKELFNTMDNVPMVNAHNQTTSVQLNPAVSTKTGTFETVSMESMRDATHMSTGAFEAIVGQKNNPQSTSDLPAEQPQSFTPHIQRDTAHSQAPTSSPSPSADSQSQELRRAQAKANQNGSGAPVDNGTDKASDAPDKDAQSTTSSTTQRKRSAIPAWDDILFGPRA